MKGKAIPFRTISYRREIGENLYNLRVSKDFLKPNHTRFNHKRFHTEANHKKEMDTLGFMKLIASGHPVTPFRE